MTVRWETMSVRLVLVVKKNNVTIIKTERERAKEEINIWNNNSIPKVNMIESATPVNSVHVPSVTIVI